MDRSETAEGGGSVAGNIGRTPDGKKVVSEAATEEIRTLVHQMAFRVRTAVTQALHALEHADAAQAEVIITGDAAIDQMEEEIERRCVQLLTTDRRFDSATQLQIRRVAASFKIVTDLERIGDHAAGIARRVLRIGGAILPKPFVDIPRMAALADEMLGRVITAFDQADVGAARRAGGDDDSIDGLYDQIFRELLTYMLDDREAVREATHLLFVASAIERIADHTTNLAEWVIYAETGHRVELNR